MGNGEHGASLSGKARTALRARAHSLKPVVWIAESGLTPGVMREIDRALAAHELIKMHAAIAGRDARAELLAAICSNLDAEPVQIIGKMLIAYRPRPEGLTTRHEGMAEPRKPSQRRRPPAAGGRRRPARSAKR